jgi:hypothetical protein
MMPLFSDTSLLAALTACDKPKFPNVHTLSAPNIVPSREFRGYTKAMRSGTLDAHFPKLATLALTGLDYQTYLPQLPESITSLSFGAPTSPLPYNNSLIVPTHTTFPRNLTKLDVRTCCVWKEDGTVLAKLPATILDLTCSPLYWVKLANEGVFDAHGDACGLRLEALKVCRYPRDALSNPYLQHNVSFLQALQKLPTSLMCVELPCASGLPSCLPPLPNLKRLVATVPDDWPYPNAKFPNLECVAPVVWAQ